MGSMDIDPTRPGRELVASNSKDMRDSSRVSLASADAGLVFGGRSFLVASLT